MPWRTRTCHTWPYYEKLYVIFCQESVKKPVVVHDSLSLLLYWGRGKGKEIAIQLSVLPLRQALALTSVCTALCALDKTGVGYHEESKHSRFS